jgi:hypothetical protein
MWLVLYFTLKSNGFYQIRLVYDNIVYEIIKFHRVYNVNKFMNVLIGYVLLMLLMFSLSVGLYFGLKAIRLI